MTSRSPLCFQRSLTPSPPCPTTSGGALACPADIARLIEVTEPSASPLEVLGIMKAVHGRVDDLLQRLRGVQARILAPLRAQRRRCPFLLTPPTPVPVPAPVEAGEVDVDVVGVTSPAREAGLMSPTATGVCV